MCDFKPSIFLVLTQALLIAGKLPSIVEDRPDASKDIFRVNPSPPLSLGEILVQNSLPVSDLQYIFNYKMEKWVNSFQPIWIPSKDVESAVTEKNCKTLFNPGTITFKGYNAYYRSDKVQWIYTTSKYSELDVKPYTDGLQTHQQFPLNRLRANCDPSSYTGCWAVQEMKQIQYLIINSKKMTGLMTGTCDFCVIGSCTTTCPNGTYATAYALADPESNVQMSDLTCISCAPGTWNTCVDKQDCSWWVSFIFLSV